MGCTLYIQTESDENSHFFLRYKAGAQGWHEVKWAKCKSESFTNATSSRRQLGSNLLKDMDTLWQLCKRGSLANVRAVLASGEVDVNARGGHLQRTCLMVAVRRQDLAEQASMDLVTLLLEQPGIKLNLTDKRGLTALHLAKSAASVRLLLAAPACDPEARDNPEKATPLMAAIWRGATDSVMEFVTTPGIDLDVQDRSGRRLEDWASGKREILEVLGHARQLDVVDWRLEGQVSSEVEVVMEVEVVELVDEEDEEESVILADEVVAARQDLQSTNLYFANYRPISN